MFNFWKFTFKLSHENFFTLPGVSAEILLCLFQNWDVCLPIWKSAPGKWSKIIFLRSPVSFSYHIVLTATLMVSCPPRTSWVYSLCDSLYVLQVLRLLFLAFWTMWIPPGLSHFRWLFEQRVQNFFAVAISQWLNLVPGDLNKAVKEGRLKLFLHMPEKHPND